MEYYMMNFKDPSTNCIYNSDSVLDGQSYLRNVFTTTPFFTAQQVSQIYTTYKVEKREGICKLSIQKTFETRTNEVGSVVHLF